jgi:hypothetical protein
MKKLLFLAPVLALSLAACKKDYTCDCSHQIKTTGGPYPTDTIIKYDYTITKNTHRVAYNHCNHTYWEHTDNGITETDDLNCSLKK